MGLSSKFTGLREPRFTKVMGIHEVSVWSRELNAGRLISATAGSRSPREILRLLFFYMGLPLAFGLGFGLMRAGMLAPLLSKPASILYWISLLCVLWLMMEVATRVVFHLSRRFTPPLWFVALLGGILQTLVATAYLAAHQHLFAAVAIPDVAFTPIFAGDLMQYLNSIPRWLLQNSGPIALWIGANYFFDRYGGLPRFRSESGPGAGMGASEAQAVPAGSASSAVEVPGQSRDLSRVIDGPQAILEKLPAKARGEILALAGEDHYVRVITNRGSALVYGRLSVIAASMPPEWGLQVHRSNWVSRTAVVKLVNMSGKHRAVLAEGTEIPVSARYVELLRRLVA
jgi:hypothetical protein